LAYSWRSFDNGAHPGTVLVAFGLCVPDQLGYDQTAKPRTRGSRTMFDRDTKELLIGLCAITIFAVALVWLQ
jgi:hypothetical protein